MISFLKIVTDAGLRVRRRSFKSETAELPGCLLRLTCDLHSSRDCGWLRGEREAIATSEGRESARVEGIMAADLVRIKTVKLI